MFNNNRESRKATTVTATGTVHHQVECLEEEWLIKLLYCNVLYWGWNWKKVHNLSARQKKEDNALDLEIMGVAGADPGLFLGGGAPLRNGVTNTNKPYFFCRIPVVLESCRSSQGGVRTPCTLPLDPPMGCKHPEWALEFQFSFVVLYIALRKKQWNLSRNRSRLSLLM